MTKKLKAQREEWEQAYNTYIRELSELDKEAQKASNRYNAMVGVINSERNSMRKSIRGLYTFLVRFGNMGVSITPFDYVCEELTTYRQEAAKASVLQEKLPFLRKLFLWFPPVAKKEGIRCAAEFERERVEWKEHLNKCEQMLHTFQTAEEIADLYRASIVSVVDSIEQCILKELLVVEAFLYAEAVKDCIIGGDDVKKARPSSIAFYEGTPYQRHYLFVRNAFDYYVFLSKVYTDCVLSAIMADRVITEEEYQAFCSDMEEVKKMQSDIREQATFGGGNS